MIVNNYITAAGLQKIICERDDLIKARSNAVEYLRTAREMGDLSENAAYHVAKHKLNSIDSRIRFLNRLIRSCVITGPVKGNLIGLGSKVKLYDGKKNHEFEMVSSFEANPVQGKISYLSPIGKMLMNKSVNDVLELKTPGGTVSYQVKSIKNSF